MYLAAAGHFIKNGFISPFKSTGISTGGRECLEACYILLAEAGDAPKPGRIRLLFAFLRTH
jgi:hypothetical protein